MNVKKKYIGTGLFLLLFLRNTLDKIYAFTSRLTLVKEDHKANWGLCYGNRLRNPTNVSNGHKTRSHYDNTAFGAAPKRFLSIGSEKNHRLSQESLKDTEAHLTWIWSSFQTSTFGKVDSLVEMRDLRHGKMLVLDENALRMVVKKSQFYGKPHIFAVRVLHKGRCYLPGFSLIGQITGLSSPKTLNCGAREKKWAQHLDKLTFFFYHSN